MAALPLTMPVVVSTATEVLGALRIFFFALQFLGETLKQLSSQRLRQRIARLTERSGIGILVGAMMITVTQSGPASVFLLVGLARAACSRYVRPSRCFWVLTSPPG